MDIQKLPHRDAVIRELKLCEKLQANAFKQMLRTLSDDGMEPADFTAACEEHAKWSDRKLKALLVADRVLTPKEIMPFLLGKRRKARDDF